jgi:hypothetical protein
MIYAVIILAVLLVSTSTALGYTCWLIYQKRRLYLAVEKNDQVRGFDGKVYRVIDIYGSGKAVTKYDVVDDSVHPNQRRLVVYPHEVVLHRKYRPSVFPMRIYEQIVNYRKCRQEMVLGKGINDVYYGKCENCGEEKRIDKTIIFEVVKL